VTQPRVATLIMAAGKSARFGGCKLLAPVNDVPLLWRSIDNAEQVTPGHVYVVTGAWHEAIAAACLKGGRQQTRLIHHQRWAQGLGSSIAQGVRQLYDSQTQYDAILIVLADQVALTPDDLAKLTTQASQQTILCAAYNSHRLGVPALFGRTHFGALMRLTGDKGAQQLLRAPGAVVKSIPMPNAAQDIDTPEALVHWQRNTPSGIERSHDSGSQQKSTMSKQPNQRESQS